MAPFVTEELWQLLFGAPGGMLIGGNWPELDSDMVDAEAGEDLGWLTRLIGAIRAARAELNVPPSAQLQLVVQGAGAPTRARLARHGEAVRRLARLATIVGTEDALPGASLQVVVDEATFALPVGEVIDIGRERARLEKEIARLDGEIAKLRQKLDSPAFVERAPAEVVAEQRERLADAEAMRDRLARALARIV
jgi:valyl-tRNA synthetase